MTLTQFAYCDRCGTRRELVLVGDGVFACYYCDAIVGGRSK